MYGACLAGDLGKVKDMLPLAKESLNEFHGCNKGNLLMW